MFDMLPPDLAGALDTTYPQLQEQATDSGTEEDTAAIPGYLLPYKEFVDYLNTHYVSSETVLPSDTNGIGTVSDQLAPALSPISDSW